jgi:serine/threonine protein kinase
MVDAAAPGQAPGQVGPYRIIRRLGAGGMGLVYLGQDETTGQLAAVKLIRPELAANEDFRARLRREVAMLQRVPRFCTAPVLAADTEARPAWVATEYIEAPTLDVLLTQQGGRLQGAPLEALAVGVAVALRALHEHGVIHRDLKPSNILMSAVGPRVIDFGIARLDEAAGQLTRTGDLLGTLAYVAPELLEGRAPTKAVDVWSWGCVVTLAGTGRLPFGGDAGGIPALTATPPDVGDLEEPLRGAVLAALARDPSTRPIATELVDRLMAGAPQVATQIVDAAAVPPTAAVGYPTVPAYPTAPAYPTIPSAPPTSPVAYPPPSAPPTSPVAYPPSAPPTSPIAYAPAGPPTSGGYPGMAPAGYTTPMGQPGYGWPPGQQPAPPPARGSRLWLVLVAVAAAVVLVGGAATAGVLLLRDQSEDDPVADPGIPTVAVPTPDVPSATDPADPPTAPSTEDQPPPSGDEFNVGLDPTFGEESVSPGFTPDPMTVQMTSGGSIDASYLNVEGCRGYGAVAPDFRLRWENDSGLLRFFFLPDELGEDTGLVVNAPDGSWHCNDDSFSTLNPTVEFESARAGQYDIWVTTYGSPGEFIPGQLNITELSSVTPSG